MTADDGLEEVDRLQVKLLELKTQQFEVMDEVEDLRHSESLLKAQIRQLENELDLLKRG
jgi:phage shock protein A